MSCLTLPLPRFATKNELFFNFIGLICAVGAGSAQARLSSFHSLRHEADTCFPQPLMSLIFGALTQDFVNFEIVRASAGAGNPDGIAALPGAAAHFRKVSSQDASYLVYIGILHCLINLR